jgi:hypothetical protein
MTISPSQSLNCICKEPFATWSSIFTGSRDEDVTLWDLDPACQCNAYSLIVGPSAEAVPEDCLLTIQLGPQIILGDTRGHVHPMSPESSGPPLLRTLPTLLERSAFAQL